MVCVLGYFGQNDNVSGFPGTGHFSKLQDVNAKMCTAPQREQRNLYSASPFPKSPIGTLRGTSRGALSGTPNPKFP